MILASITLAPTTLFPMNDASCVVPRRHYFKCMNTALICKPLVRTMLLRFHQDFYSLRLPGRSTFSVQLQTLRTSLKIFPSSIILNTVDFNAGSVSFLFLSNNLLIEEHVKIRLKRCVSFTETRLCSLSRAHSNEQPIFCPHCATNNEVGEKIASLA